MKGKKRSNNNLQPGSLRAQVQCIKTKKDGASQLLSGTEVPNLMQNQFDIIVAQNRREDTQSSYDGNTTDDGEHNASTANKRRRGCNKNHALQKLTSNGNKLMVHFNKKTKRPMDNLKLWGRHLGAVVRQNNILPHCTEMWKMLTPATLDSLWQAVIDKFDAVDDNIELYRDATLREMRMHWNDWRHELNKKYIRPHKGNLNAIKSACPPPGFIEANWNWLLDKYYFSEKYQRSSITNTENRKKVKYHHHTGSKSFSQLHQEITTEAEGRPPLYQELLLRIRTGKKGVDASVLQKVDEMRSIREKTSNISTIDLVEQAFGPQNHGTVIGMGPVSASLLRGPNTKRQLREQNVELQNKLDELTKQQQESDSRIKDLEAKRNEDMKRYEALRSADMARHEAARLADNQNIEEKVLAMMLSFCSKQSPSSVGPSSIFLFNLSQMPFKSTLASSFMPGSSHQGNPERDQDVHNNNEEDED